VPRAIVRPSQDAFGQEILAAHRGEEVIEIAERDDGFVAASHGPVNYLAAHRGWPAHQRKAIRLAHGRVLDLGAGAGRVALHLQERGLDVVAIDNSPLAVRVCRLRGVKDVRLASIAQVSSRMGAFDTIVLFGNNFGLLGSPARARRLLRRFHRLTGPDATMLAESSDVDRTEEPAHLAYQARNRRRGRMPGQIRLRVRFGRTAGPWFDFLLVSPREMKALLRDTGWRVRRFFRAADSPSYVAIVEKARRRGASAARGR
jgi:SAM-dependent methyltransferase